MNKFDDKKLDWKKMTGLIPAIIQDARGGDVLMLGYMNQEALAITYESGQLTLFSRSRNELWHKGASSGHTMAVQTISTDCDGDSLLIQVLPQGPACHLGFKTCFEPFVSTSIGFLNDLINLVSERLHVQPHTSYTAQLLQSGTARCAQKIGEEATEVVIAAIRHDKKELINESADLVYHLLVLLTACNIDFYSVINCLKQRNSLK
jgi:phosphoribosyl-ATP pyrophosphohydrolase/phosphoribosyl-AMP cyclohydrolase